MGEDLEGAIDDLARGLGKVASAITPVLVGSKDETDGYVESLTEAVMGVTAALMAIARSIDGLTEAVRDSGES